MSEKYKVIDSAQPTFITLTITDWVDLFIRPEYSKILDDSLLYCINHKGLVVHAYVYMTSHLHLIVTSTKNPIQDIVRDFKRHTSLKLIEAIREHAESRREWLLAKFAFAAQRGGRAKNYKVWKDGFHPVLLDSYKKVEQRVHYIRYNPVAARLVYNEAAWINSSYCAYEDGLKMRPNIPVKPLW